MCCREPSIVTNVTVWAYTRMEVCVICKHCIESASDKVSLTTRGLETLIKCSIQRDDDLKDILQTNSGSLVLHSSCRKDYTRGSSIKSYKRKLKNGDDFDDHDNINPTKLRSRVGYPTFDFKVDCLFCTEPVEKSRVNQDHVGIFKTCFKKS